jgi:hypothetical protein
MIGSPDIAFQERRLQFTLRYEEPAPTQRGSAIASLTLSGADVWRQRPFTAKVPTEPSCESLNRAYGWEPLRRA